MKHLPVAGKTLTVLFTAAFLVACSGSSTREDQEAAAAAARAADAARMQQQAEAEAGAAAREMEAAMEQAAAAFGNVFYFAFDSSVLTPEAIRALDAHIAALRTNQRNMRLEGHADERGTREYNLALGERRANSVRDYMVFNGISSYRIETVSFGEERPVAYGSGEANWSKNRRVELDVK